MLHRFGGVGGAVGRIPFAAGERRVLLPFSRRKKAVAARLRARGCTILFAARRAAGLGKVWPCGQTCRAGVSADKPAAVFCPIPGKEKSGFGSGTLSETQAGVWSARISSGWRLVAGRRLKERGNTMKTGNDVFNRALLLLGYTGIDGAVNGAQSAELFRRELDVLNQVMADLWPLEKDEVYQPLVNVNENIPLSVAAVENVMPYGVAMFLAQADGDGANQQLYATLYQQKRNAVKKPLKTRADVLPAPAEG